MRSPLRIRSRIAITAAVSAAVLCVAVVSGIVVAGLATPAAPPANAQFDYQLGGAYEPSSSVGVVDRDRTSTPAAGRYTICYVNAFQTQPDDTTTWSGKNDDLILRDSDGERVGDPEWDEYLLDTSTKAKRDRIAAIVNGWIDECASKGFRAVEPDNLDSWTRSAGMLTQADNVALATQLAAHSHRKGLAIAQKNAAELAWAGKNTVGFDFAIAEECQLNAECGEYTKVYGDDVIEIEYTDTPRSAYTDACAAQGKRISVILRDRDVVPKSDGAYRYKHC
ncbi:endo alpha-1,4 polygalactosaminidase [Leifsonia sp. NPDC058292]|uniref:endo alpha-1,4 polygalactosaminidase n=1 Tax=Leifsonia sp. NPDC058292 TaxID=3346428 RepID=UPI0036D85D38